MGCWNETCVLSRTPIGYGAPVVALTTVTGPIYREPSGGGFKTDLLFGLPLQGEYDDFGGVENYAHPQQKKFADNAFIASGLYRLHTTKNSPGLGSGTSRWVANTPNIFWGLEPAMKHVFYPRLGVKMSEAESFDPAARAKTSAAFVACQQALVTLGKGLRESTLPEAEGEFLDALFAEVSKAFGADAAWGAWDFLRKQGLFAQTGVLLMHQDVYAAVVTEFSQRKVYKYGSKERHSLRDFLKEKLEAWVPAYEASVQKTTEMLAASAASGVDSPRHSELKVDDFAVNNSFMKPLTSPWKAPDTPLKGHFWGGASVAEVLAAHDQDQILDFMVFQWARSYLRIDLTRPASGSQNEESKLHLKMMQAAFRTLRAGRGLKEDFYGGLPDD